MWAKILKYQQWHILMVTGLVFLIFFYVKTDTTFLDGEFWGLSTLNWLILTLLVPVLHQVYVLICWRLELHYQGISKRFGKKGFGLYKIGFAILILSRPATIILLAISNAMSLEMDPIFSYVISGILVLPAIYLAYSVKKYFGIDRAFGIDHFYPQKFKNAPMVRQGIFKYTANAMYVYGFLILWVPGILLQSKAALLAALFNHIYIWVHYYFTELPDMNIIYGKDDQ